MTAIATEVKSRPILFSSPMVRAILDGRKTQTRRVIKPQPIWEPHDGLLAFDDRVNRKIGEPFQTGMHLWVRETFALSTVYEKDSGNQGQLPDTLQGTSIWYKAGGGKQFKSAVQGRWRPSIFMPRWASRITLEVTGVKVERLNQMSYSDYIAEGIIDTGRLNHTSGVRPNEQFKELWNSINEKRGFGWESNPWVWVVEFRKV